MLGRIGVYNIDHSRCWCHWTDLWWRTQQWWGAASEVFGSESAPSLSGCGCSAKQLSPAASPPPPCCGPCCPTASWELQGTKQLTENSTDHYNKSEKKRTDLQSADARNASSHLPRRPDGLLCTVTGSWGTLAGRAGCTAGVSRQQHWNQAATATAPVYQATHCKGNIIMRQLS